MQTEVRKLPKKTVFTIAVIKIIAMIIGSIAGSWLGTKLRDKIDAKKFTIILKVLLTALAIKVIVFVFI